MTSKEMEATIRLMIIEDNATLILAALRNFFRPERDGIQVYKAFPGAEEAVESAVANDFDVILLDLMIPGQMPENNIFLLKSHFPGKPVVIYTSLDVDLWRRTMHHLGAHGYVHKNDGRDVLKRNIVDAFNGKVTLTSGKVHPAEAVSGFRMMTEPALSLVELEMIKMHANGSRYKQIAQTLYLTEDVVETTFKRIRKKFGAGSNSQLTHLLTLQGLL